MQIDESNLAAYAKGCAVLCAGGGGDVVAELAVRQALGDHGPVTVISSDELAEDALIMPLADMGAPTVYLEKLWTGTEIDRLLMGFERAVGGRAAALMPASIGGSNGLTPIMWAARAGLPIVDADLMGRAYPELQITTATLAGFSGNPTVLTDERGNVVVIRAQDQRWLERIARSVVVELGSGGVALSAYPLTAGAVPVAGVPGSVTRALRIGEILDSAASDPVATLVSALDALHIFSGKVVETARRTRGGFTIGTIEVEGIGEFAGRVTRIDYQNEFLAAFGDDRVLATVPDVIAPLDLETGIAISTERVRYGQRMAIIAFPSPPIWRTEAGLRLGGPRAFGYEFDYTPPTAVSGILPEGVGS